MPTEWWKDWESFGCEKSNDSVGSSSRGSPRCYPRCAPPGSSTVNPLHANHTLERPPTPKNDSITLPLCFFPPFSYSSSSIPPATTSSPSAAAASPLTAASTYPSPLDSSFASLLKSLRITQNILALGQAEKNELSSCSSFPPSTLLYFLSLLQYHEYLVITTTTTTVSSRPVFSSSAPGDFTRGSAPQAPPSLAYPIRRVNSAARCTSPSVATTTSVEDNIPPCLPLPFISFEGCGRGRGGRPSSSLRGGGFHIGGYPSLTSFSPYTTRAAAAAAAASPPSSSSSFASKRFVLTPWQQVCKLYDRLQEKYRTLRHQQERELQQLRATHHMDGTALMELLSARPFSGEIETFDDSLLKATVARHEQEIRTMRCRHAREEWTMEKQFQKLFLECVETLVTEQVLGGGGGACLTRLQPLWRCGEYLFSNQYGLKKMRKRMEAKYKKEMELVYRENVCSGDSVQGREKNGSRYSPIHRGTSSISRCRGWSSGNYTGMAERGLLQNTKEAKKALPEKTRRNPGGEEEIRRLPPPRSSLSSSFSLSVGWDTLALAIPFYGIPVISLFVPSSLPFLSPPWGGKEIHRSATCMPQRQRVVNDSRGPEGKQETKGAKERNGDFGGNEKGRERISPTALPPSSHSATARHIQRQFLLSRYPLVMNFSSVVDLPRCLGKEWILAPPMPSSSANISSFSFRHREEMGKEEGGGEQRRWGYSREHPLRINSPSTFTSASISANVTSPGCQNIENWRAGKANQEAEEGTKIKREEGGGKGRRRKGIVKGEDEQEECQDDWSGKGRKESDNQEAAKAYAGFRLKMISAHLQSLCAETLGMLFLLGTLEEAEELLHAIHAPELILPSRPPSSLHSLLSLSPQSFSSSSPFLGGEGRDPLWSSITNNNQKNRIKRKPSARWWTERDGKRRSPICQRNGKEESHEEEAMEEENDDDGDDKKDDGEANKGETQESGGEGFDSVLHSGWKRLVLPGEEKNAEEGRRNPGGILHMCTTTRLWGVQVIIVYTPPPPPSPSSFCSLFSFSHQGDPPNSPLHRPSPPFDHLNAKGAEGVGVGEAGGGGRPSSFARTLLDVLEATQGWSVTSLLIAPLGSCCTPDAFTPFLSSSEPPSLSPFPLSPPPSPPPALWITSFLLQQVYNVLRDRRHASNNPLYGARLFIPSEECGSWEYHQTTSAPSSSPPFTNPPSGGCSPAREEILPLLDAKDGLYVHLFVPLDPEVIQNSVPHRNGHDLAAEEELMQRSAAGAAGDGANSRGTQEIQKDLHAARSSACSRHPLPDSWHKKREESRREGEVRMDNDDGDYRRCFSSSSPLSPEEEKAPSLASPFSRSLEKIGRFLHIPFSSDVEGRNGNNMSLTESKESLAGVLPVSPPGEGGGVSWHCVSLPAENTMAHDPVTTPRGRESTSATPAGVGATSYRHIPYPHRYRRGFPIVPDGPRLPLATAEDFCFLQQHPPLSYPPCPPPSRTARVASTVTRMTSASSSKSSTALAESGTQEKEGSKVGSSFFSSSFRPSSDAMPPSSPPPPPPFPSSCPFSDPHHEMNENPTPQSERRNKDKENHPLQPQVLCRQDHSGKTATGVVARRRNGARKGKEDEGVGEGSSGKIRSFSQWKWFTSSSVEEGDGRWNPPEPPHVLGHTRIPDDVQNNTAHPLPYDAKRSGNVLADFLTHVFQSPVKML